MSVRLFVCLCVSLSLKISVTTELIGFYSPGNIPTGLTGTWKQSIYNFISENAVNKYCLNKVK